jgi:hypothetical protein
MSMRLRIRAAQVAELTRLEKIGAISLEQLVRERVRVDGPCMGQGRAMHFMRRKKARRAAGPTPRRVRTLVETGDHEMTIINKLKGGEKSNDGSPK